MTDSQKRCFDTVQLSPRPSDIAELKKEAINLAALVLDAQNELMNNVVDHPLENVPAFLIPVIQNIGHAAIRAQNVVGTINNMNTLKGSVVHHDR